MPINNYGVLKGKAKDTREGQGKSPHFQVKVSNHEKYRIAINVKSQVEPSTLLYCIDENFDHPILKNLQALPFGFKKLDSVAGGMALDFIRGNLFDTALMKPLPYNVPGPDNDLNELLQKSMKRSMAMQSSVVYAFGQRWGPENDKPDDYFDFLPGNGIHDIHMNQGNSSEWKGDDGPWQDGGLVFHFPDENRWVALFLAFQSQCFHTDDATGHRIPEACDVPAADGRVCILAALVNPPGPDKGLESVTILNITPKPIDLKGWKIADRNKNKAPLSGILKAGQTMTIKLPGTVIDLPNDGGIITLLDNNGLKVHGVSYSEKDAKKEGWTIVF
ncbi:Uncharacterised protein [uncultured archaeon]|nr:Uncharacterised protein [uncultured archaeon]